MPKCKAITKSCPACTKQVAVACKNCPCGHTFFVARRTAGMPKSREDIQFSVNTSAENSDSSTVRFRRTERIKRDKPDFYDASEYDKQRKKSSRQKLSTSFSEDRDDGNNDEEGSGTSVLGKKGRGRRRRKGALAGDASIDDKRIEDDEPPAPVSAMKQFHFSVGLTEINRKLLAVNPIF